NHRRGDRSMAAGHRRAKGFGGPMIPILPRRSPGRSIIAVLSAGLLLATLPSGAAPATPYRGLWVGQVVLNYANEVSVPLNSNNIPIAPDPKVPTPTRDAANLRLILHVS